MNEPDAAKLVINLKVPAIIQAALTQSSSKVVVTASRAAVRARAGQLEQLRKTGSTLPARALICRPFLRQTGGSRSTGTTVLTVTMERQEQTGPVWPGLA